jgi:hypothetical protein
MTHLEFEPVFSGPALAISSLLYNAGDKVEHYAPQVGI